MNTVHRRLFCRVGQRCRRGRGNPHMQGVAGKGKAAITIGLIAIMLAAVIAADRPATKPLGSGGSRCLVFDDEFNGTTLDRSKWSTQFPWGARTIASNHELEWYTDNAFQVANGVLRIRAERRRIRGFSYTSGMIASYAGFASTYGYFEMRARMPRGKGLWPAFWLVPRDQSWPPEIDVVELHGDTPRIAHMTNHYRDAGVARQISRTFSGPDFSQSFHTFGLAWRPHQIIWFIDGVERFRTGTGVSSKPMYMIVNLAVGGDDPGAPDAATPFPSYLDVDYIRVYRSFPPDLCGSQPDRRHRAAGLPLKQQATVKIGAKAHGGATDDD